MSVLVTGGAGYIGSQTVLDDVRGSLRSIPSHRPERVSDRRNPQSVPRGWRPRGSLPALLGDPGPHCDFFCSRICQRASYEVVLHVNDNKKFVFFHVSFLLYKSKIV